MAFGQDILQGLGIGKGDNGQGFYSPLYPFSHWGEAGLHGLGVGNNPLTNTANLSQFVGPNLATAAGLYGQAGQNQGGINQNVTAQQGLVSSLGDVVNGTAPSVAQNQLGQGLGAIQATQQSNAAGASGQNAALANTVAAQQMQQAQVQANQQAALIRAQEVAQARAQQGGVLANIGGELGQSQGQNLNAAGQAGQTAEQAGAANSAAESARVSGNKQLISNFVGGAGKGLAMLAA